MDWRDSFALHIFRTLFYFTAQIGGAVLGTIMLYAVVPNAMKGHILLGAIHVGEGQAFFITTVGAFAPCLWSIDCVAALAVCSWCLRRVFHSSQSYCFASHVEPSFID